MISRTYGYGVLALTLLAPPGEAARKVAPGEPIIARLEHGSPTAVILPEPIAGMGVVVDPERFSVDYNGPVMFLQPLVPQLRGRLFAVGASGKLYNVTYQVREPADDEIYVLSEQQQPQRQVPATQQTFGMPALMRALRTGVPLPGQAAVDLPAPVLQDVRLHLTGWQAMQVHDLIGLTVAVRNASDQPLGVDIRYGIGPGDGPAPGVARLADWVMPPRYTVKGVTAERDVLGAQESTQIYFVLEKRP